MMLFRIKSIFSFHLHSEKSYDVYHIENSIVKFGRERYNLASSDLYVGNAAACTSTLSIDHNIEYKF